MQCIVAIGGGGFLMEDVSSPIDQYLLGLLAKARPRICFVSTPSGDLPEHLERFYAAYPSDRCHATHLAFFRKPSPGAVPLNAFQGHLRTQDLVIVGGGNTRSTLAVWREWDLHLAFREALRAGAILAGVSAGAMCWFEHGMADSTWGTNYRPLPCLGFLQGGCAVHYNGDTARRRALHEAVAASTIGNSLAIDDHAAAVYQGGELSRILSWHEGATAYRVVGENGGAKETPCPCERIG